MSAAAAAARGPGTQALGWRLPGRRCSFPPALGAGIVNVTSDSFFSGARSGTPERAIEDGLALAAAGFDLLDVGAVAARSGPPVAPADEAARLVAAIEALARESGLPVLADTFSARVAAAALEAGAAAINDISGGTDREMLAVLAASDCGYVLTHIDGPPRAHRKPPRRADVVTELREWFRRGLERLAGAGVEPERIVLDPGFDFDLSVDDDLELLRRLAELRELGRPLFVALSRKDFLGAVAAGSWEERVAPEQREPATLAAVSLAVAAGADVLRLHDSSALDAMRVASRIAHA